MNNFPIFKIYYTKHVQVFNVKMPFKLFHPYACQNCDSPINVKFDLQRINNDQAFFVHITTYMV